MSESLYEQDFYAWANQQAALLRAGKLAEADIALIAEEIESMGKTEKRELVSRLEVLLFHLLKWRYQSLGRSVSWQLTIKEQRRRVVRHLADNPSLKHRLPETMEDAYGDAIIAAARETFFPESTFPDTCPWSFDRIVSSDFWPDGN